MNPELVSGLSMLNVLLTGLFIIIIVISILEFLRAVLRMPARKWPKLDQARGSSVAIHLGLLVSVILCCWLGVDIMSMAFSLEVTNFGIVLTGLVLGVSAVVIYKALPPCYPRSVSSTTVTPKDQK